MIYIIVEDDPLPESVARALNEYFAKYGPPPVWAVGVSVETHNGEVEIKEFTAEETT